MKRYIFALSLLTLPGLANAQTVTNYEFCSVAVDYPASAANSPYTVQGTGGQPFATSDPPTNTGQIQVYAGFGQTYIPYVYLAQMALDSFVGHADPGVTYGIGTNIPFVAETFDVNGISGGILPGATFFADATGTVKVLSSLNPAFAQSLSVKGPLWLRQNRTLTPPADPVNGYPSASFTLTGGDANGDNIVDVADFGVLVNAYLGSVSVPGSGYDPNADFNQDGSVDISDFGILINNFTVTGAP